MKTEKDIWGPMPSSEEIDIAIRKNDERLKKHSKQAIDLSYESQLFAYELGITVEELWALGRQKKVVQFSVETTKFYPKWQINKGKLLEGLEQVVANWFSGGADLALFATRPSRFLDGRTPVDCLKDGQVPLVLQAIQFTDPYNRM